MPRGGEFTAEQIIGSHHEAEVTLAQVKTAGESGWSARARSNVSVTRSPSWPPSVWASGSRWLGYACSVNS